MIAMAIRRSTARAIWKIAFAVTALLEIRYIVTLMRRRAEDDDGAHADDSSQQEFDDERGYCESTSTFANHHHQHRYDDEFSIHYTFLDRVQEASTQFLHSCQRWIGPLFCTLCLLESLIRAVECRNMALDNRALDDLEEALLRAAQKSSVRLSFFFKGANADRPRRSATSGGISAGGTGGGGGHNNRRLTRAMRSWIPAIATISFWLFVLPADVADLFHDHRRRQCVGAATGGPEARLLRDSAVLTRWIDAASLRFADLSAAFRGLVEHLFWTRILPYRPQRNPMRFARRLRVILRWIRFARFAAPLFRMALKLQDQVRAFFRARRQSKRSEMAKQRRIDRPSMISLDIQRLLQLAKLQTALARVPSFSLLSPSKLNKISSSVMEKVDNRRRLGKKISNRLAHLQRDYLNFSVNGSFTTTSDLYDRVVKMSQDITVTIQSERGKYSHRYLRALRALLSSRRYLVSPRTRFSLAWRMTVTNCLLIEIARLCASWHLSGSFSISLSRIVGALLADCEEAPGENDGMGQRLLAFVTDRIDRFRRRAFDALPLLVGSPPADVVAACVPSGPQATLILHFGGALEFFVDAVVFTDIFVWFFTGDIDAVTHNVIPKPFFTRCILPGTLVQVLDHPTLPNLLPGLLKSILATFATIGYSRCIRWLLAIVPALKIVLLDPMNTFFFRHMEDDEGLMHIAESVGMLTPERKSAVALRTPDQWKSGTFRESGPGVGGKRQTFFRRQSSDAFNTSQVGLAYDSSPLSSRYDLQSMVSTEGSSIDGSSLHPPSFSGIPMQSSPLKKDKSVHFGLFNNGTPPSEDKIRMDDSVGYSLSTDG